jgi:hypothetical protein
METPNTSALAGRFAADGLDGRAVRLAFSGVTAQAPAFAQEAARHG